MDRVVRPMGVFVRSGGRTVETMARYGSVARERATSAAVFYVLMSSYVDIIRSLIASGEWSPTRDILRLSETWGVSEQVVFEAAVEAHSRASSVRMSEDHEVTAALARLRATYDKAAAAQKAVPCCGELVMVPSPDFKAMIHAEEVYLRTIGALTAKKAKDLQGGTDAKTLLLSEMTSNPDFARLIAGALLPEEIAALPR